MSDLIANWLKKGKCNVKKPPQLILPDPLKITDVDKAGAVTAANESVHKELSSVATCETPNTTRKRKRSGQYGDYSPDVRLKIATHCLEHGPAKTARHFSAELGRPVNECTVRNMKKSYLSSPRREIFKREMPRSPRGRPTTLPSDVDQLVKDYVKSLRLAGAVVNTSIIIAGATGILEHKNGSLLKANGGPVDLTKDWAKSLMKRMGLSKRKGTKGLKTLPTDFDEIKEAYVSRVTAAIETQTIPHSLVINWDQTGVNLMPCGNWTMDVKGSKQVPIKGIDDKRQVTMLLAIAKSGAVLPPQVIYPGLTDNCHPKFEFPKSWDIFNTPSHWSTEDSMMRYVETVILPYVEHVREEEDLPLQQKALCIFDVYSAHRGEKLLKLLDKNGIKVVFVPGSCTDRLQPLDLIPNNIFKSCLKSEFQSYYAGEITEQLSAGVEMSDIKIDLRTSVVRPIHAQWLVNAVQKLAEKPDVIVESFVKAGL